MAHTDWNYEVDHPAALVFERRHPVISLQPPCLMSLYRLQEPVLLIWTLFMSISLSLLSLATSLLMDVMSVDIPAMSRFWSAQYSRVASCALLTVCILLLLSS